MTDGTETGAAGDKPKSSGYGPAPVYAAGIIVAGGLLFAGWGVTHAAIEGNGPFKDKGGDSVAVAAPTTGQGDSSNDGVVTLPDLDNDGVPDQYRDGGGGRKDTAHDSKESGRGDEADSDTHGSKTATTKDDDGPETYIIEKGDTLTEISAETSVPIGTLVKVNDVQNPNLIYAGSALLIPQVG